MSRGRVRRWLLRKAVATRPFAELGPDANTAVARVARTLWQRRKPSALLGLVMIVKNEAKSIEAIIASVKPWCDCWLILDTGSTDGTPELAARAWGDVPGLLLHEPFVDFATTRNRALDLFGEAAVFSLMLSGDEALVNGQALRAFCEAEWDESDGAHNVLIDYSGSIYPSTRLARTAAYWRYAGATHEVIMPPHLAPTDRPPVRLVAGVRIAHDAQPISRDALERDKRLLEKDFASGAGTTNTWFYYGRTLEGLGELPEALAAYKTRLSLPGHQEELILTALHSARCLAKLGRIEDAIERYLGTYTRSPHRAEALFEVATLCAEHELWDQAHQYAARAAQIPQPPVHQSLIIDVSIYAWKRYYLLAQTAARAGDATLRRAAVAKALEGQPPNNVREKLFALRDLEAP